MPSGAESHTRSFLQLQPGMTACLACAQEGTAPGEGGKGRRPAPGPGSAPPTEQQLSKEPTVQTLPVCCRCRGRSEKRLNFEKLRSAFRTDCAVNQHRPSHYVVLPRDGWGFRVQRWCLGSVAGQDSGLINVLRMACHLSAHSVEFTSESDEPPATREIHRHR